MRDRIAVCVFPLTTFDWLLAKSSLKEGAMKYSVCSGRKEGD
jgi:hypothetical protein